MQTNQRKLRCRESCWRYSARVILFSWGTESFSMYSLKAEDKKKQQLIPHTKQGRAPSALCVDAEVSLLSSNPNLSSPWTRSKQYSLHNVCLLLARTTGNRPPKKHLSSEPKIQISVHKSILLLLATPLCICSSSRSLQSAHLADLARSAVLVQHKAGSL